MRYFYQPPIFNILFAFCAIMLVKDVLYDINVGNFLMLLVHFGWMVVMTMHIKNSEIIEITYVNDRIRRYSVIGVSVFEIVVRAMQGTLFVTNLLNSVFMIIALLLQDANDGGGGGGHREPKPETRRKAGMARALVVISDDFDAYTEDAP